MIAAWLAYTVVVAAVAGLAAYALEFAARLYRLPARGVWIAAMAVSVLAPLIALVAPTAGRVAEPVTAAGSPGAAAAVTTEIEALLGSIESTMAPLDAPILVSWLASSLLLMSVLAWSLWRLGRQRRWWRRTEIGEGTVLLSGDIGPAVVGVVGGTVVMPRWVLGLRTEQQELILRHEMEHLKAGDLRLMLGALAICVAVPWCTPLWWQLRRLRSAIEADCDRRVVKSGVGVAQYADLLLHVGGRARRCAVPVLTITNNRSVLARRIDLMTWKPRRRFAQLSVALAAVVGLVLVACETPAPEQTVDALAPTDPLQADAAEGLEAAVPAPADAAEGTTLTIAVEETGETQGDPVSHIRIRPSEPGDGPAPLILIDEKEVTEAAMRELDPDDIDRIEVLKGAAAENLYGEKGKGGVIQIFLKKQ